MTTHRLIIGANYGDEGKGTVVAHYTKHADGKVLNVLTNGGSQRAHNIETETGRYKFQHFGSGTIFGADNYYGPDFIINPLQYSKEYDEKEEMLKNVTIYRHPLCRWSTPYDMMANQIIEMKKRTGSCGMGIWETVLRYLEGPHIPFDKFIKMDTLSQLQFLDKVKIYFEKRLEYIPKEYFSVWNDNQFLKRHFIEDCKFLYNTTIENEKINTEIYSEIIYENGQGLMLNDNGLDDGATTPSCTGRNSIIGLTNSNVSLHYVTRPYITKHGGFEINECKKENISSSINEDWANPYNEWQGNFRYSELNIQTLKNVIVSDATNLDFTLEVTHCDEMDRLSEFGSVFGKERIKTYDSAIIK